MKTDKPQNQPKKKKKKKGSLKWAIQIFIVTLIISSTLSATSEMIMEGASATVAIIVILALIFLGVFFDMIGVAVTSASDTAFVAMASKKVRGAKESLKILHNAEKVSNFCNDVVGDICGIVSGTAGATLAIIAAGHFDMLSIFIWSIVISSLTAALTISLKSAGKGIAITKSKEIVQAAGYVVSLLPHRNK